MADLEDRIREMTAAAENSTAAFGVIGRSLVTRIQIGFKTSRSPWGVPWLPIKFRVPPVRMKAAKEGRVQVRDEQGRLVLTRAGAAQSALNQAAAKGKGAAGKPLVNTRKLLQSITFSATSNSVEVGTNAKQAKLQHFGGTVVPKNRQALAFAGPMGEIVFSKAVTIPARPFMPINPQGAAMLPPAWANGILRELAAHLKLVPA